MTAVVYSQNDAVVELGRRGLTVDRNLVSYLMRDPLRRIPARRLGGANVMDDEGLDRLEAEARSYLRHANSPQTN